MTSARLYSIGHSNHDMARLLDLLRAAGVTAVADVRSQPFSRYSSHFNRPELERALRAADLGYAFLGDLLGGRPTDMSVYDASGQVNYERVRATAWFQQGLEKLLRGSEDFVVAMLCAEEDPLVCHRALMIGPALVECGQAPCHIRGDGELETTAEMEERLLRETGVGVGILDGLFADTVDAAERARLLVEAYQEQARRKAYRLSVPE
ncbi:MAG TPA: DUF488 domain-containing protein [Gemmataceae bacterium]|nr:DUF488 domain-containing protein [Gemmataceae bacterium]